MLALTECHDVGKESTGDHRSRIGAAALGNPLVDWTALFPKGSDAMPIGCLQNHKPISRPQNPTRGDEDSLSIRETPDCSIVEHEQMAARDKEYLSLQSLLNSRQVHFRKPEHFFDPFASPSLFFRTPAFDLPHEQSFPISNGASSVAAFSKDEAPAVVRKKRVYNRRYPPLNANLLLPPIKVTFGEKNMLKEQALDFVKLLQRSALWEKGPGPSNHADAALTKFMAEKKEGLGLWGEQEYKNIGAWMGEILRRP